MGNFLFKIAYRDIYVDSGHYKPVEKSFSKIPRDNR